MVDLNEANALQFGAGCQVPGRFADAVFCHLMANASCGAEETELFLGIHGPPGTGKTWQLSRCLRDLGCAVTIVDASWFESERANLPVVRLTTRYGEAAEAQAKTRIPGAIVINDVDMGLGIRALTQYTVNLQHLVKFFMDLADDPQGTVGLGPEPAYRIPVFLTGNDLSALHGPLRRTGRMRMFEWIPNAEELRGISLGIFPELGWQCREELLRLASGYAPVAFLAAVKRRLREQRDGNLASTGDRRAVLLERIGGSMPESLACPPDENHLLEVARSLRAEQDVRNHINDSLKALNQEAA